MSTAAPAPHILDNALNGIMLVQAAGIRCILGPENRYYWRERTIMLTRDVATGRAKHWELVVAHEIAHDRQPRWWFWLRWLEPVRWLIEADAWERAIREA